MSGYGGGSIFSHNDYQRSHPDGMRNGSSAAQTATKWTVPYERRDPVGSSGGGVRNRESDYRRWSSGHSDDLDKRYSSRQPAAGDSYGSSSQELRRHQYEPAQASNTTAAYKHRGSAEQNNTTSSYRTGGNRPLGTGTSADPIVMMPGRNGNTSGMSRSSNNSMANASMQQYGRGFSVGNSSSSGGGMSKPASLSASVPAGNVPAGVNRSWLEPSSSSHHQPSHNNFSRQQQQQQQEQEKAERERQRKLAELTYKEKQLEQKERFLRDEMRRKEEERRAAQLLREEELRLAELRRREEEIVAREKQRLLEINIREVELREKEERLRMMENARRMEEERLLEEQRVFNLKMNFQARQNERDNEYAPPRRSHSPHHALARRRSPSRSDRDHHHSGHTNKALSSMRHGRGGVDRHQHGRHPYRDTRSSTATDLRRGGRRQPESRNDHNQKRGSAFQRLGDKVTIQSRLGGSNNARNVRGRTGPISVTVNSNYPRKGNNTDPIPEHFQTIDEVGEVDPEEELRQQKEREENLKTERSIKERLLKAEEEKKRKLAEAAEEIDLDKVVIKKRTKKSNDAKATAASSEDKVLVVKTPNSLVGLLAKKLKEMPKPVVAPKQKTAQQKSALKKKIKIKYAKTSIPEKILYMALENVGFDEKRGNQLINKLLQEEKSVNGENEVIQVDEEEDNIVINLEDDDIVDEDKLDYEADEPEVA